MKSHKKEIIIIAVLMAALLVIFTGLLTPEATQTQECSMIYIPKIKDDANDFWTELISGCQMAAEEYNSELEIMAPAKEEDIEEQNQLLREAIEKKPDAILFSPSSMSASDELLKEAKDQGIRITYIDSYTEEEILLGPVLMQKKEDDYIAYCQKQYEKYKTILEKSSGRSDASIQKKFLILEEFLKQ